jgi:hypothetical protein
MGRDFSYQVEHEDGSLNEQDGWNDLRAVVPFLSRRNRQMEDEERHTTTTLVGAILEAAKGLAQATKDGDEQSAEEWNQRVFALSVVFSDMSPSSLVRIRYQ